MKAFFIISRTSEMHKHFESWTCLGNEARTYTYNHSPHKRDKARTGEYLDREIIERASEYKPDAIVYVGAAQGNIPSTAVFTKLRRDVAPTVLFCSDAADEPWWPKLSEYDSERAFNLMVALDGNHDWPFYKKNMTTLTPLDPSYYPETPKPHSQRTIEFGFAGDTGGIIDMGDGTFLGRKFIIDDMVKFGLQCRNRDTTEGDLEQAKGSYRQCAEFISNTRIMPNVPNTGSWKKFHVKGRIVECGWAGTLVMEQVKSPTRNWFVPGEDFIEYDNTQDAKIALLKMRENPDKAESMALSLRAKVLSEHHPQKFWNRIMGRL